MNISIPLIVLPSVAAACRKHAVELKESCEEMENILGQPFCLVAEPEVERLRLRTLKLEAENLLLVARLIGVVLEREGGERS